MTMGVYAVANTVTGDLFIGSSINIESRWHDIRDELKHRSQSSVGWLMHQAWREYGAETFELRILEEVTDRATLEARTRHYVDKLMPKYNGKVSYRRNESVPVQGRRTRMTLSPFPSNDDHEQEDVSMGTGRNCERYGEYYWCVKVPTSISLDGEIYVFADRVEIVDGALVCIGHNNQKEGDKELIYLALGSGQWIAFFAASVIDGAAVAVEHWKGEVLE